MIYLRLQFTHGVWGWQRAPAKTPFQGPASWIQYQSLAATGDVCMGRLAWSNACCSEVTSIRGGPHARQPCASASESGSHSLSLVMRMFRPTSPFAPRATPTLAMRTSWGVCRHTSRSTPCSTARTPMAKIKTVGGGEETKVLETDRLEESVFWFFTPKGGQSQSL